MPADKAHDNTPGKKSAEITPERYRKIRSLFESALGISLATLRRDWKFARAWLLSQLGERN